MTNVDLNRAALIPTHSTSSSPLLLFRPCLILFRSPSSLGSSHLHNACGSENAGAFPARLAPDPPTWQRCQPAPVLAQVAKCVGGPQHLQILRRLREIEASREHWYHWSRRSRKGQSVIRDADGLCLAELLRHHIKEAFLSSRSGPRTLRLTHPNHRPLCQQPSQSVRPRRVLPASSSMVPSTRLPRSASVVSPFPLPTSSTRPRPATTPTSTVPVTPITSRT